MRAYVSIRDLRNALNTVQPAVNRESNLPFAPVHMVRVTTDRNGVQLTAVSRDMIIQSSVPNRSARRAARGFGRPGRAHNSTWATIVRFDPLKDFLHGGHPSNATVELRLTDDRMLRVGVAARSVSLATLDPTTWPPPATAPLRRLAGEPLLPLRSWWARVVPACAPAKKIVLRPVLTGLNLRWSDGALVAAAMDSYRAHTLTIQACAPREVDLTIPPAALKAALDVAKAEDGSPLSAWATADHPPAEVAFRTQRTTVRAKAIEGDFPSASAFLPDRKEYTTVVRITDAAAAVATLRSICRQVDPDTPVMLEFDRGTVTYSAKAAGPRAATGGRLAGLTVEASEVPVVERWCNPRFLADAIAATGNNGTLLLHPHVLDLKLLLRNDGFAGLVMLVNPEFIR